MTLHYNYTTVHYTTLIKPHHNYNRTATNTTLHWLYCTDTALECNHGCTTPHYIQQLWVRWPLQTLQPLQKHNSRHLSVHQWIRSAIHASQQLTSPIVPYPWNFRHRLVRGYWWYVFTHITSSHLHIFTSCIFTSCTQTFDATKLAESMSQYCITSYCKACTEARGGQRASTTTPYYKVWTKHFPVLLRTAKLAANYFPVLLRTTKFAQSASQYFFGLQSLHKVLPSTTSYYKVSTKYVQVLLRTLYYIVLQSLQTVLPSTTLHYKVCSKYFPVLLRTTKLAQSTSQYYFVLQSLQKEFPSTTLYYKVCSKYFPVLLRTTKFAQSTSQYYFVLQTLHRGRERGRGHSVLLRTTKFAQSTSLCWSSSSSNFIYWFDSRDEFG